MTKYVSSFFAPIYEKWALSNKKSLPKLDKLIDAIYHENEFKLWLTNKFNKGSKKFEYSTLCTSENFSLYVRFYNKLKNKEEEKLKKEDILEGIKAENIGPRQKNPFDIDIVANYVKIKNELEKLKKPKPGIVISRFLESALSPIEYYCRDNDLPIKTILSGQYPIVVDHSAHDYEIHLARTLMTFDLNRINSLLDYQNAAWQGKSFFPSIVEHGTYNYIAKNSPFNSNICLKKLIQWVEKNRVFVPNPVNKKYDYWPYENEKLGQLEDLLVKNDFITESASFKNDFEKIKKFHKPTIIWKGSQPQLMALMYLIYNGKDHNRIPIHSITTFLFRKTNVEYNPKGLNTILNQVIPMIKDKSNKKLDRIRNIVSMLELA